MRRALLALKIAVTVGVLGAALAAADLHALGRLLGAARPGYFAAAVGALLVQTLVLAARFRGIVTGLGPPLGAADAVGLTFVGVLFNQVLPSAVGGDAVRAWQLRARGRRWADAVAAVLLDRGSGVLVLAVLAAAAVALEPSGAFARLRGVLLAVAAAGIAAAALLAAAGRLPFFPATVRRLLESNGLPAGARVVFATKLALPTAAWSAASHLLAALAAYWLAAAVGVDVAAGTFVAAALCMVLATMVPLSYAGWGVREVGAVWLLAQLAVPAESALAISMLFGAAMFVAALPGAAFWLAPSPERRKIAVSRLENTP